MKRRCATEEMLPDFAGEKSPQLFSAKYLAALIIYAIIFAAHRHFFPVCLCQWESGIDPVLTA